jgi:hypothetical protein
MSKIKNLKIYSKNIAKIAVNSSILIAPFALASSIAIFRPTLITDNTIFRDTMDYPALITETMNNNGEIISSINYINPGLIESEVKDSVIKIIYQWERTTNGYERLEEVYQLDGNDILIANSIINDPSKIGQLKNQLDLIETIKQTTNKLSGTNEITAEIKTFRIDESDFISQKESYIENLPFLLLGILTGGIYIYLAANLMSSNGMSNFVGDRFDAIEDAREKINAVKTKTLKK